MPTTPTPARHDDARAITEAAVVAQLYPRDTRRVAIGHIQGWAFRLHDAYGTTYTLFTWHDGDCYQVAAVDPPIERVVSRFVACLTEEGTLKLAGRDGFTSLDEALRGSITWVNGIGVLLRTAEAAGA
jgi:hypothetical protein